MATREAMAIQREAELGRVESEYKRITGRDVTPMRRTYKDDLFLHVEHLRTIADWLEHMPPVNANRATDDTLTQAQDAARSGATKADIIAILLGDNHDDPDNQ